MPIYLLILWYCSVASLTAAIVRCFSSGLVSRYPYFTAYAICSVLKSFLLFGLMRISTDAYTFGWSTLESVTTILYLFAIRECWILTSERYPDIGSFGRTIFGALVCVALLGSLFFAPFDIGLGREWGTVLPRIFALRRFLLFAGALFMLAGWITMELLPIPSRRNFVIHRRVLAAHAVSAAIAQFVVNIYAQRWVEQASIWGLGTSVICWTSWSLLMNRRGENLNYTPPTRQQAMEANSRIQSIRGGLDSIRDRLN